MYHAQSKHATNKTFVVKTGISHIVKRLKLVCVFAIGAVQIHDVTGEAFAWQRACVCSFLPNSRLRSKIFHHTIASSVQPF